MPSVERPIPILFMQSQTFYGADTALHALLMRHFDRRQVEVFAACDPRPHPNAPESAYAFPKIAALPDVHIRRTDFGPTLDRTTGLEKVRRTAIGAASSARVILSLAAYARRNRIQIIHGTEKPRDAFYGVLIARLAKARSVVHMHVNYGAWQSRTTRWALQRADAVIGVSQFTADSIVQAGIPAERVHAVHNALDLGDGWKPSLDGAAVRQELGIPQDAPVIGIVARLFRWKGHADLIAALARIVPQVPNVRLVIVGEDDRRGQPGGGSFREELEAQVARLGIGNNVIFTGFRTDTPRLFAAFDVYAMPTWEEPFGMVFLEAMAMRKPVLAYRSGGVREIVVEGETGYLTEPKDIGELSEALRTLVEQRDLRERMGHAGRSRLEECFTPAHMCRDVIAVYRAALGQKPVAVPTSALQDQIASARAVRAAGGFK